MQRRQNLTWMVATMVLALAWVGCSQDGASDDAAPAEPAPEPIEVVKTPPAMTAEAVLQPAATTEGMSGTVTFTEAEGAVSVEVHLAGAPTGPHGFHIHEVGDCSASDFTSAGGHFNPATVDHAGPDDAVRHGGDLGNVVVGDDGSAHYQVSSDQVTLGEGDNSIMGRAVVVHKDADDLTSQPTGAAGARIACGVIAVPAADDDSADEAPADEEQAAH